MENAVARHAYPSLDNLSPRLAEELRKRIAPDRGNVWKMLMWSPGMAEPFIDFNDAVRYKITLPDSLRELIILRVGHAKRPTRSIITPASRARSA
jgi:alkylhydroperoxidase family enzyme